MKKQTLLKANSINFSVSEPIYTKIIGDISVKGVNIDIDTFIDYSFRKLGDLRWDEAIQYDNTFVFNSNSQEELDEKILAFNECLTQFCENRIFDPNHFEKTYLNNPHDLDEEHLNVNHYSSLSLNLFCGRRIEGSSAIELLSNFDCPKRGLFFEDYDDEFDIGPYVIFYSTLEDMKEEFPEDEVGFFELNRYGEILELPEPAYGNIYKIRLDDLEEFFGLTPGDFEFNSMNESPGM